MRLPRLLTAPFDTEAFYDVPTRGYPTREGEVDLPIKYRDATAVGVAYPVPLEAARAQAAPLGVEALEVPGRPGHGLAWIWWFEYRETSVGPYNELAVGVLAARGRAGPLEGTGRAGSLAARQRPGPLATLQSLTGLGPAGVAILHLPVTTPVAWAAGVDLWGFPKIVADLQYDWTPATLEARMDHEGRPVLSMRLPLGRGVPLPVPNMATLSVRERTLLKTVLRTHSVGRLGGGRTTVLRIEDPKHPVGRTLTELALPERPLAVLHIPQLRLLLPAGEPLGRVAASESPTRPNRNGGPPTQRQSAAS